MENPMVDSLNETIKKVEASLMPAIDSICDKRGSDGEVISPSSLGLDFLHVKNTLLLSYLIDLVVNLRDTVEPLQPPRLATDNEDESKNEDIDSEVDRNQQQQYQQQKRRLLEMRTALDKSRVLDKKLRYQIDKLLSSLTDSSAYATGGEGADDGDDSGSDDGDRNESPYVQDDPLRYRPNPESMLDHSEENNSSEDEDDVPDENSADGTDDEEDDDLAAARATLSLSKRKKSKNKPQKDEDDEDDGDESNTKYVAPRLAAVPYTHDVADKRLEQEKRQKRKLRASELAQTLRQQYGDQPDTEDVFGGGSSELYGKQRSASRALARREAERTEFEESTMIRLTTSRKEKKEKKRVERMMEGGSNLAQIANLGNLVRETEAFGSNENVDDSDDEYGERERALQAYMSGEQNNQKSGGKSSRHANGKRRREPMAESRDGSGRRLKMGKRPKAYNSLQAELYGGSGKKSSKSKKRR